ncbi:parallel beta-helix domain-containing protein [Mangrovivirga cuniculi]|uniref:Right handed beta helix domain-containing protein n=1 Tax=Mangrovivirga cuniculi TaxID=2715131 RepID=A0A4D7JEV5_9BACT|nr:parallel beta-helix domain-containing protein [Mangrovivirga cuniculi]QCK14201.1 hypothetical protein DCC35_05305 [Mangrovivirga cuniculi]
MKQLNLALLVIFLLFLGACDDEEDSRNRIVISPGPDAQAEVQTAFIEVTPGTDIIFEAGTYNFTNQLSIDDKNDIRIIGAGREETILNFSQQTDGGEGLLATNCENILFQDFTIEDTEGDALKARDSDFVTFLNVGTVWSGTPGTDNGAYGLYPVLCTNVLIDGCYAYGASDAGIYVGQTTNAVVRNSTAEGNVAGIEIENTINADVYGNTATDNTGGILIFDLPGLSQYGNTCRVYNNTVSDNNRSNFAPEGNVVAEVPAGTGIMMLSTRKVEIFDNDLLDNMFANIIAASYLIINDNPGDPDYVAFWNEIYIHDNTYSRNGTYNQNQNQTAMCINTFIETWNELEQPDILIDGITGGAFCVQETPTPSFINVDAFNLDTSDCSGTAKTDLSIYDCVGEALPAVSFDPYGSSL